MTGTTPEKVAITLRILKSPCCEIEIAGRMIKRIRDEEMCDGVHVMAIGREEVVPDILSAAALI